MMNQEAVDMKKTMSASIGVFIVVLLSFIFAEPASGWQSCPDCQHWDPELGRCEWSCLPSECCDNGVCCWDDCCGGICCPLPEYCCGDKCYDWLTYGCCDGTKYDLETQGCCDDTIYDKSTHECCEDLTIYDPNTKKCCNDGLGHTCLKEKGCCDGECYDPETQGCCDDLTIYDPNTKKCCNEGTGHTCEKSPVEMICCEGDCCDPSYPRCEECIDGECKCPSITSVTSNLEDNCVGGSFTFTVTIDPIITYDCVSWSGGGTPSSQSGGSMFATSWDSSGTKTVTASCTNCGSSQTKNVKVIGVSSVSEDKTKACVNEDITFTANASPSGPLDCINWEKRYRADTGSAWGSWSSATGGDNTAVLNTTTAGYYQYRAKNGSHSWRESSVVSIVKVDKKQ